MTPPDPSPTYKDEPLLAFETQAAWRAWLDAHHADVAGIWLRFYKKASGQPTVTYAEALDEALCYGWIDSTKNAYDAPSFVQRFTPRKPRSPWSKVNVGHVARLEADGRILPPGRRAIDEAKANGQWEAAYDPASTATIPDDLQALLDAHPAAAAHLETLNRSNRYALIYRIQSAKKPETRQKRLTWALDLLLAGGRVH